MPFGVVKLTERYRGRVACAASFLSFLAIYCSFIILLDIFLFIFPSPMMKMLPESRETRMLQFFIIVGCINLLIHAACLTFSLDNWTLGTRWVKRMPVLILQGLVGLAAALSFLSLAVSVHLYVSFGPDLREEFRQTMVDMGRTGVPSSNLVKRMENLHQLQNDYNCCGFEPDGGLKEWLCDGNTTSYLLGTFSSKIHNVRSQENWRCRSVDGVPSCFIPFSCCNIGSAKCLPSILLEEHNWDHEKVAIGMNNMFAKAGCQDHVNRPPFALALILTFALAFVCEGILLTLIRLLETSCRTAIEEQMPEEPMPGWLFSSGTPEEKEQLLAEYRQAARKSAFIPNKDNVPRPELPAYLKKEARLRKIHRHDKFWRGLLEHVNDDVPSIYMDDLSYSEGSGAEDEERDTESKRGGDETAGSVRDAKSQGPGTSSSSVGVKEAAKKEEESAKEKGK